MRMRILECLMQQILFSAPASSIHNIHKRSIVFHRLLSIIRFSPTQSQSKQGQGIDWPIGARDLMSHFSALAWDGHTHPQKFMWSRERGAEYQIALI